MTASNDAAWKLEALREDSIRCVMQRVRATGELVLPALPSLVDHYLELLTTLFGQLGRLLDAAERSQLRDMLSTTIGDAFRLSASSNVFVRYRVQRDGGVTYAVAAAPVSMSHEYGYWLDQKEAPFGLHADARVLDLASELSNTFELAALRCLDLGSGGGRNGLELAQLGHAVDSVDAAQDMVRLQQRLARQRGVPLNVTHADILDATWEPEAEAYHLVVVSEVTSHFRDPDDLRLLMSKVSRALLPRACCVVSVFLPLPGFTPDALTREVAQMVWSTLFTRQDLESAIFGQGLVVQAEDGFADYELEHQAVGVWPQTTWVESWAGGEDIFGPPEPDEQRPVSLRWIVLRKEA